MGCDIIFKDDQIASDEASTEFVQGLLGLFHLTAHFLDKLNDIDLVIQLSQAMLHCLEKFCRYLKDVEAIAGNFYLNLWNMANKISSAPDHRLRSFSLRILIHSGVQNWTRVIDRILSATVDRSKTSVHLVEEVLDHFMMFTCHRPGDHEMQQMSALLSLWAHLLSFSDHQRQDGRTRRLIQLASKTSKSEQLLMLVEIVLNVVGATEVDLSKKWNQVKCFLLEQMQLFFMIMAQLALHCSSMFVNQTKGSCNSCQIATVYLVLAYFVENIDVVKGVVESHIQTDAKKLKLKFLPRTISVCVVLLKSDPSRSKDVTSLLLSAENLALTLKQDEQSATNLFSAIGS